MTVETYLEAGGFPEPMQIAEGDRLLRQYFEDIVERDIRERIGARSALPIRQVVQMVFESAGSELSLRRLASATGLAVAGLRRIAVSPTGRDRGKSLECATYIALRRCYGDVYYWRGRGEVDFVFTRDGVVVPCQVTWEEPAPRHERALEDFYESFPQAAECMFVTRDDFESFIEGLG